MDGAGVLKIHRCSCMQDYGGAVVIGDDVQAFFTGCSFTNNGRGLCADQDITLVNWIDNDHRTLSLPAFSVYESVLQIGRAHV